MVLADILVQVVWLKVEMVPNQSRRYQVYRIGYWTKKGTWRVYIGYTGQEDVRKVFHKRMPPGWVKCRAPCCEAQWRTLESDVVGEQMALTLEAFHASRAIVAEPLTVRGGPWVKPTLPKDEDAKMFLVSTMRLAALLAYPESRDSELLWRQKEPSLRACQGRTQWFSCPTGGVCGEEEEERQGNKKWSLWVPI